jgi:hypothetical protein
METKILYKEIKTTYRMEILIYWMEIQTA